MGIFIPYFNILPDTSQIIEEFESIYGKDDRPVGLFFAPGRVNLIGEHTDYNNGFVLPCAISNGTYLAIRPSETNCHSFHSANREYYAQVPVDEYYRKIDDKWINYPLGVIQAFQERAFKVPATDFYYHGDIPDSAGLSSSASIEMVTAYALNDLYGSEFQKIDLVHLSKAAENQFVGVNCGIMDQFAVGMGKKDHALFLNCGTLSHNLVPLNLRPYCLVIMNTNKPRVLAGSKYNERVAECNAAVSQLKEMTGITSLGQMNIEDFEMHHFAISDENVKKRARHVISENRRVLEAVKALWNGNLHHFGQLMKESHESLRDDYEVTGFELDSIVEASLGQSGVIGARMTGAGFGGCAIALVHEDTMEDFIKETRNIYKKKTGLEADFYLPGIGDGVKSLS